MLDDIFGIPEHLRDAVWRVQTAGLRDVDAAGALICGVGGSAIGGDLAAAALGERRSKPVVTVRGYTLPPWVSPQWLVLCSSYSGETAETLSCIDAATRIGVPLVAATTGGSLAETAREAGAPVVGLPGVFQPRAAVAYMFVVSAEAAAMAGAGPRLHAEIEEAAGFLEACREDLDELAQSIAAQFGDTVPVVHGCDLTTAVARRWKTQINENAKHPAAFSELPEAGHNELEGWTEAAAGTLCAVFLEDSDQPDRERQRMELTAGLLAEREVTVVRVETRGASRTARLLWGVMLGDLVSVRLAERLGNDPEPVAALDFVKSSLRS